LILRRFSGIFEPVDQAKRILANLLRGAALGVANIIPGVSGGTIAVVLRVYDRLIDAIAGVTGFEPGMWRRVWFLAQIAVGAVVGIFALARVIEVFLERAPVPTTYFFIGLIAGSLPVIVAECRRRPIRPLHAVAALLGFVAVLLLGGFGAPEATQALTELTVANGIVLGLSGIAGAAAMVIPGISGSFLLLVIGTYATVIAAINNLDAMLLAPVALGVLIGLVLVTRLIRFVLNRYPQPTYMAILGLVAGSAVKLFPGLPELWAASALALIGGFLLALLLGGTFGGSPERRAVSRGTAS
jgi:putative membrane protein